MSAKSADAMKRYGRKLFTRKLFSQPVPMKERLEEWRIMESLGDAGVEAGVEMMATQNLGPETALDTLWRLNKEASNGKASNPIAPPVDDPSSGMGQILY